MLRLAITQTLVVEVSEEDFSLDDFKDSYLDDLLDAQESEHETSDGKFHFTPKEIVGVAFHMREE